MEIYWSDEDQTYFTIPDGDIATHKQIHDYYNKETIETKLYFDNNCTRIIEEINHTHIPHLD